MMMDSSPRDGPTVVGASPAAMPLRLLSMDGGGIRGISELLILGEIMHRLKRVLNSPVDLLPANFFDMMCGTSTGGLNVLLLGRLRLSVPEAISRYSEIAEQVFTSKKLFWQDGRFSASKLEEAIKCLLRDTLGEGHEDDRMFMPPDLFPMTCKSFVCAVASRHVKGDPRRLRTWSAAKDEGYDCKIWEAARATSAAPRIFKSIFIGANGIMEEFVDAGVGCNNPVQQVISEALVEFGGHRTVSCILSLGAGSVQTPGFSRPKVLQRLFPTDLIKTLVAMVTTSEDEATVMESKYQHMPGVYHRLNVGRDLESVSLEEWKELNTVTSHTIAYLRLNKISSQIDHIVATLARQVQPKYEIRLDHLGLEIVLPVVTSKHVCFPDFQVDRRSFVPRSCMPEIDGMFDDMSKSPPLLTVVLHGMGGCGKTQLALHYCRRAASSGKFHAVLWVDGTAITTVEQSFVTIARSTMTSIADTLEPASLIPLLLSQIRGWNTPWLLVFDNFDSPFAYNINDYLPQSDRGIIIITSRYVGSRELGHAISIGDLLEYEAVELLFHRIKLDKTLENLLEARKICRTLSCLALAVDQAGSYIASRNLEIKLFIEQFNEQRETILSERSALWRYRRKNPSAPDQDIHLTVSTTWELSYNLIGGSQDTIEAKRRFLFTSAFLDGSQVEERLFRNYFDNATLRPEWMKLFEDEKERTWNRFAFQELIAELGNLSLFTSWTIASDGAVFSFHPMVQSWAQYRHSETEKGVFALAATSLLSHSTHGLHTGLDDEEYRAYHAQKHLRLHIEACFVNCENYTSTSTMLRSEGSVDMALFMARFFWHEGRYDRAEMLQRRVLVRCRHDDPRYYRAIRQLSSTLVSVRRFEAAAKLQIEAFQSITDIEVGTDYESQIIAELGIIQRHQGTSGETGKLIESKTLLERALGIRETLFGKSSMKYADVMAELALAYYELDGRQEDAKNMQLKVLDIRTAHLGEQHQSTLLAKGNLAMFIWKLGDLDGAEKLEREVYNDRNEVLGRMHPDMIRAQSYLAITRGSQKRFQQAADLHREAIYNAENLFGAKHAVTCRYARSFSRMLRAQGLMEEAETINKRHPYPYLK